MIQSNGFRTFIHEEKKKEDIPILLQTNNVSMVNGRKATSYETNKTMIDDDN